MPVWKSKFYARSAIDATPARWRGDAGSSPLDRARTAAPSPRNDLQPTHWLIFTQVCDVLEKSFTLMLIEHTQKCVVLPQRAIGDEVNLEVDVIAKYARRSVGDFDALTKRVEELETRLEGLEGCIPGYDWDDAAGPTSGSAKPVRGSSA